MTHRTALLIAAALMVFAILACAPAAGPTPTLFVLPTLAPTLDPNQPAPITPSPTPIPATPDPGVPTPTSLSGGGGQATALPEDAEIGTVVYVVDGDTIHVSIGGTEYKVRYVGVNTPERDEPCYDEATARNSELVLDQIVTLVRDVSDTDDFGRLLRYVYAGDIFVNAQLVMEGWAESRRYAPDDAQYEFTESLEATAADQGLGCWPTGVFER
jgi:micrococcal nuclease